MDAGKIGQTQTHKQGTDAYDAEHGGYEPNVEKGGENATEQLLPTKEFPMAPAPSPFKIGPA